MKKPMIEKVTYPIWFKVLYFLLTVVAPLTLIMIKGYESPSGTFKITFTIIVGTLIVWIFLNKLFIARYIKELKEHQILREHDYEIDVGNKTKIKYLWFRSEKILTIIDAITVTIYGLLIAVVLSAISEKLIEIKGLMVMVSACYIVAYFIKFFVIMIRGMNNE